MKRALLIAGGTVGGLGAVLSITPPQLGSNGISTLAGASADTSLPQATQSAAAVTTATPVATKKATATATKKATATATKSASTTSTNNSNNTNNSNTTSNTTSESATPTPVATKSAAAKATTASGSFTGDAIDVGYGLVQVKIIVSNGKITDAVAVQAPSGRSQRFTDYSVPNLRQQTLTAQSAAIRGVGGASYTSYGWYKSLISALQKAGMATGV